MVWDSAATASQITFTRNSHCRLMVSLIVVALVIAVASSISLVIPQLVGVVASSVPLQHMIVIDTDPGVDDAMAILTILGDKRSKVLGITCVRGNTGIPRVVTNTLKILKVAGKLDIPVYSGTDHGLLVSPVSDDYFGKDGLGDVPFPDTPPHSIIQEEHAASFLARIVGEYPGKVTIVAIGPLTNIALAYHLNPKFLNQARRLLVLGGTIKGSGNMAPGVEFNFYMDPDAASFVLEKSMSAHLVRIIPMETVIDHDLTLDWRWNMVAKIDNPAVSFLNKMEKNRINNSTKSMYHPYDSYLAAITLSPEAVTKMEKQFGFVENRAQRSNGALFVDYMNLTKNKANLEIVTGMDKLVVKNLIFENLSNL